VDPLPADAVQVAPPSIDFHTCGTPNVVYVAYTTFVFTGS